MLIPLDYLARKYRLRIGGVLHVGAHAAEERDAYVKLGVTKMVWVEANANRCLEMSNRLPNDKVICAVVSDVDGEVVTFHEANNGQSSSILELGTHSKAHPEVHYIKEESRLADRLDSLYEKNDIDSSLNFLNLDIQGAELKALIGLGDKLENFNYIYSEVNKESLYKGCALINQIDEFLSEFKRVEVKWTQFGWGDAFYVRKTNV